MKITSGRNPLAVGVDYREEYPKVCYQSIQMKEAHFVIQWMKMRCKYEAATSDLCAGSG